jgi:hypothetical protein
MFTMQPQPTFTPSTAEAKQPVHWFLEAWLQSSNKEPMYGLVHPNPYQSHCSAWLTGLRVVGHAHVALLTSRKHGKKELQSFSHCDFLDHPELQTLNECIFIYLVHQLKF